MKTDYNTLSSEIREHLLSLYADGVDKDVIKEYWANKMTELKSLDPKFNEKKLKDLVFTE